MRSVLNTQWFAILVPAVIGFAMSGLSVRVFHLYGFTLFLGLPFLVSLLSGFCTSFRRKASFGNAYGNAVLSLLSLGCFIFAFAMDGLVCLFMAFPLALLLALPGTAIGCSLGSNWQGGGGATLPVIALLAFPGATAMERAASPPPPTRKVVTSVKVRAPIQRVWDSVVAFPKITAPPNGIFCCGIAYPIEARIDGSGVGAVRHCVFSTGSFVEPITIWNEPSLLAFTVDASPPPMREVSLYEHIDAPHLHGHMVSERGQFQLTELNGQVVLEGTTWYHHTLSPQWYWGPISDYMIHRIHERVLDHIKSTAENAPGISIKQTRP